MSLTWFFLGSPLRWSLLPEMSTEVLLASAALAARSVASLTSAAASSAASLRSSSRAASSRPAASRSSLCRSSSVLGDGTVFFLLLIFSLLFKIVTGGYLRKFITVLFFSLSVK